MEGETTGIKELAEVVSFGVTAGVGIKKASEDGLGVSDLGLVMALAPQARQALDGLDEIPGELADLSEQEAEELVRIVDEGLAGVLGDRAEAIVDASLQFVVKAVGLIETIREAGVELPAVPAAA